jgi:hypothetical protein
VLAEFGDDPNRYDSAKSGVKCVTVAKT